ncbi:hypothetical protein [Trinickia sp.]|uniref:hypothetical protein n=1 Tax=Trinickia sp. TaxID=2571163 RepID=UPI003F7ED1A8
MRAWMAGMACMGAMLVAACAGLPGTAGGQRFEALQASCGPATDYGADTQSVYGTLYDAYVAYRHGGLAQADYCAFENDIARHYRARSGGGPDAQRAWAEYFNAQRARAIDWRAAVDPTLRGG